MLYKYIITCYKQSEPTLTPGKGKKMEDLIALLKDAEDQVLVAELSLNKVKAAVKAYPELMVRAETLQARLESHKKNLLGALTSVVQTKGQALEYSLPGGERPRRVQVSKRPRVFYIPSLEKYVTPNFFVEKHWLYWPLARALLRTIKNWSDASKLDQESAVFRDFMKKLDELNKVPA